MKTPIEKASAVRSGGSSSASKRRKVERNICGQAFLPVSSEVTRDVDRQECLSYLYLKLLKASASLS